MAVWRGTGAGAVMMVLAAALVFIGVLTIIFGGTCAAADIHGQRLTTKNKNPIGISSAHANIKHHRHQVVIRGYYIGTRTTTTMNQQQKQTRAGSKSDGNYMTNKRKVPNGPDPIHNRRAGNSRQPPGQA